MRPPLLLVVCVATSASPTAHAPITGCVPPDNERGCACDWDKDATNSATFAGLSHPGAWTPAEIAASGLPEPVIKAADSDPKACELVCCQALLITDAPAAAQAPAQTAPCDIWQHGGGTGAGGCWLGIDNTKRQPPLPIVTRGSGHWTGGTGRLAKSSNWGWSFLAIVFLGAGVYVGGGVAVGVRPAAGRARTLPAHPHYSGWLQIYGMAIDGVRLTRSVVGGGGAAKTASGGTARQANGNVTSSPRSPEKKRKEGGKSKGKHKANKSTASGKTTEGKHVDIPPQSNLDESLVASPTATSQSQTSSTAGGGGRWVHVPR